MTRFSIAAAPQRYADVARALGPDCAAPDHSDEQACDQLLRWIERACASLKLPRLSECPGATREVFEAEVERMAADALASGSPDNNPVIPTAEQIVALYREIW